MLKVIFIRIPLISGIFYDMLITDDNAIPPFVNLTSKYQLLVGGNNGNDAMAKN